LQCVTPPAERPHVRAPQCTVPAFSFHAAILRPHSAALLRCCDTRRQLSKRTHASQQQPLSTRPLRSFRRAGETAQPRPSCSHRWMRSRRVHSHTSAGSRLLSLRSMPSGTLLGCHGGLTPAAQPRTCAAQACPAHRHAGSPAAPRTACAHTSTAHNRLPLEGTQGHSTPPPPAQYPPPHVRNPGHAPIRSGMARHRCAYSSRATPKGLSPAAPAGPREGHPRHIRLSPSARVDDLPANTRYVDDTIINKWYDTLMTCQPTHDTGSVPQWRVAMHAMWCMML
jgi:hypothetical protein